MELEKTESKQIIQPNKTLEKKTKLELYEKEQALQAMNRRVDERLGMAKHRQEEGGKSWKK